MKKLFSRHQNRLSVQEDRKVWSALHDAVSKPEKKTRSLWVPSIALGGVAALLAVFILGPDQLTQGTQDAFKQPGTHSPEIALQTEPNVEALRAVPYLDGTDPSADELRARRAQTLGDDAVKAKAVDAEGVKADAVEGEAMDAPGSVDKIDRTDLSTEDRVPSRKEKLSKPETSPAEVALEVPLEEKESAGAKPATAPQVLDQDEGIEEAVGNLTRDFRENRTVEENSPKDRKSKEDFLGWAQFPSPLSKAEDAADFNRRMQKKSSPEASQQLVQPEPIKLGARASTDPRAGRESSETDEESYRRLVAEAKQGVAGTAASKLFMSPRRYPRLVVAPARSSASYKAVSETLRSGKLPRLKDIRVESFINQVRVAPKPSNEPVSLSLEAAPSPFGDDRTTLLRVQLFTGEPDSLASALVAKNLRLEMEFDPDVVEGFRLLGYESQAQESAGQYRVRGLEGGTDLYQNASTTTLVELKIKPATSTAAIGLVRARYVDPETDRVEEISKSLMSSDVEPRWENTDPSFVIDAVMAEFAETLQEPDSPFHDLYEVLGFAKLARDRIGSNHPFHRELPVLEIAARLLRDQREQR